VSLTFLLGGARSGKSALAVQLAQQAGGQVTVIATAEAGDDEMSDRIRAHRAERPPDWQTIEEPLELDRAIATVDGGDVLVIDCLTLWVANLLARGDHDAEIEALGNAAAEHASARTAPTVAISNEVGLGIVPANELGRRYRDVLGRVNATWAAAADEPAFVVAGRMLRLS
jgi:adenosylcobinamide kinase / adenosylcobinamide-phosphate guanylyltransferase